MKRCHCVRNNRLYVTGTGILRSVRFDCLTIGAKSNKKC